MATHKPAASAAAKVLNKPSAPKNDKSAAASALAQVPKGGAKK